MTLTAFKTEQQAYSPQIFFRPTLESFANVFARSDYAKYALNSIVISLGSTLCCFAIAIPAAYRMTFFPTRRTRSLLVWMLSTKMMPAVGVLLPVYLLMKSASLLDSLAGLVLVNMLINLPIAVWMSYTYFGDIPPAILEAARVDGAGIIHEIRHVLTPIALPGIASTALL